MHLAIQQNKVMTGILLSLIMALMISIVTPFKSFAEESGGTGINGVNVNIDDKGNLKVSGKDFASGSASAWNNLIAKYKKFIVGISGIGAVTMIGFFIFAFMKLGASAGNPSARAQALVGVLWTGVAAAGLGAVTIIVGFFYNSIG